MKILILQIATALAERYLSRRLNGVRVKIDVSKLLAEFGDQKAGRRVGRLTDAERRIVEQLKRIRPTPNEGAFAYDEKGRLGMITRKADFSGDGWHGIQLGDPGGKTPGGPWHSLDPLVVGHRAALREKKNGKVSISD